MKNPIYVPKGKALEYSHLALNLYTGCDNGCTYCYAPSVLHKDREVFAEVKPRNGILHALRVQMNKWEVSHKERDGMNHERVLLCFTCDPYPSIDTDITRRALAMLRTAGIPFTVLTKSGASALRDIDIYGPNDAFGTTLTFINDGDSKKWEPNAALPLDRMSTLKKFHDAGIHTWGSLEPVIDPVQTLELIKATHEFVDHYKVGKLNYAKSPINWAAFGMRAIRDLEAFGKKYYIKKDLAVYLDGVSFTNTDNRRARYAVI